MSLFSCLSGKMFSVHPSPLFSIAVQSQYWGLNSAVNNADVVLGPETNNPTQRWNFTLIRLGNQ